MYMHIRVTVYITYAYHIKLPIISNSDFDEQLQLQVNKRCAADKGRKRQWWKSP